MDWVKSIGQALDYIEQNIAEELDIESIAAQALLSPFHFQRGFSMLCGFTVGEYIRQRRLTLAGSELLCTDAKVIDIAVKYGYDAAGSFTKAFTRFHGVTPTAVRKEGAMIKLFAPLKIKFSLEGGHIMDYKIVEKQAFTVMGVSKVFRYDDAMNGIPAFWTAHYQAGQGDTVCGMYGVCTERDKDTGEMEYMIADNYMPCKDVPDGYETKSIPQHTWAVFPCKGAMPQALQQVNQKIYSEWLPACANYDIAGGFNIELYSNPADYPKGNQDENYYSEIWITVKKK